MDGFTPFGQSVTEQGVGMGPPVQNSAATRGLDLLERMDLCQSRSELAGVFHDYVAALGFAHVTCFKVPEVGDEDADCILMTSGPNAWTQHYLESGFMRRDPVIRELFRNYEPYTWIDVRRRRHLTDEDQEFFVAATAFGFNDGYCVPIVESGGYTGLISLPAHTLRLPAGGYTAVRSACVALHAKLSQLYRRHADRVYDLTDRELHCLRWAAAGKSDWEIGLILSISAKTVNYHIENTKRKFGVATRVQAIVAALRSGKLVA